MPTPSIPLSQLLSQVQDSIKDVLDGTYWVVAEIASVSGNRHVYFELIEKKDERIEAKCRANLWAFNATRVITHFQMVTQESLKAGMKVLLNVSVEFHVQYGFSLTIHDIDPSYSLGEFERIKQETIRSLMSEGLMDMNKALSLSTILKNIAVVSSTTAAGYQDFVQQLTQNEFGYTFNINLFSALVQGEKAPQSLLQAINNVEKSSTNFDALVIIRGGGSAIDLSCFDDFEFNYYLAQSTLPVITGIGHDRDQSVSDLVAHTALKTPTAVAQFLIKHNSQAEDYILQLGTTITQHAEHVIQNRTQIIERLSTGLTNLTQWEIREGWQQLSSLQRQLILSSKNTIQLHQRNLLHSENRVHSGVKSYLNHTNSKFDQLTKAIEAHNPELVLKRGYSLLRKPVPLSVDSIIEIETFTHNITAVIKEIRDK